MLDQQTKRKIDSARNILVGNVTNPISQVDQITNALIYKFMDDMDQENIDVDLKAQFFIGDYAKYSWTKLLDKKLSGQERMSLYMQATESMSKNPHIPQLFRDIFKGAFLPYNDPRVLTLFLKEIDGFSYSHSEELGNAFEYLLSILGSQGDAGQFRTPRHIIDFIAEVVDPKKNETILDPACGTAGFLISAYKHILKAHDGLDNKTGKPTNKEKNLTPAEKTKLMNNIVGYDVSPDMVKLSLVNMYLHGFQDPKIHKYNTLTDEKRWDEQFDVIMANPPFMTPKGGVETHKRFSIQANRAEVLFVDYIMEHLSIKGRAGIIVPEGIIFQSANAYKALRKKLVEDGLFAVVSLPAGVFNPYAGVKTSVLLFDNQVAKMTDEMLFIKIENDGFDLGAQRRPIDKNDLPRVIEILEAWKTDKKIKDEKALWVKKEKIAESGDYNLTGKRYREVEVYKNQKWEMVGLGDICEFIGGYAFKSGELKKEKSNEKDLPVIKIGNVGKSGVLDFSGVQYFENKDFLKKYLIMQDDILIAMTGATVGKVAYSQFDNLLLNQRVGLVRADENKILKSFLKSFLLSKNFYNYCQLQAGGGAQGNISPNQIKKFKIPLPPLGVQKEIVEQIEKYQNIVDGARMVVESWKPSFWIDPKWEIAKLGDISERITKGTTPTTAGFKFQDSGINFIKIESIDDNGYFIAPKFAHIDQKCNEALKRSQLREGDVLFSIAGALGRVALVNKDILPANTNQALAIITPNGNLNSKYLEEVLRSPLIFNKIDGLKVGMAQYNISLTQVSDFEIPLPSLEIQKQIVAKIEVERKIVEANKKMIEIYEQKIKDVLSEI